MISRLPRWVEIGGFALALIAGSVNAIALLGISHQGASHLTGSSTLLGIELANGDADAAVHLLYIIGSFVLGASVSGFVIGGESLKLGRRYGLALLVESAALVAATMLLVSGSSGGHYLASAACGLQNAMTSTYSGAVVRTTHLTGLFTDLGITLGLRLRGQAADRRRIVLYITLICGFVVGGVVGALAFARWSLLSLLAPASLAAVMAIAYFTYRYTHEVPSSPPT